jgi:phenylpropionate dioxygenase-like ring-hydroxylating dioxygenase large terminal subunit
MSSDVATLIPYSARAKKPPRYPFPSFPTGWFQVAYADDIKPGEVKPLEYFGKQLVMFRSESGKVSVLDAYCPHLGAHLGHGGRVVGETVECPFHAWKFGTDGACAGVPYSQKIPPRSSLGCWPVNEVNGLIMVWHDIDKQPPAWEVPQIPEATDSAWTTPLRREWKIRTHNQETAENVVDKAHFRYLHGTQNMPDSQLEWDAHKVHMVTPTTMKTPMGKVEGKVESNTVGLGFSTTRFTGIVETLLMGCPTPIDEEYLHLRFTFTVRKIGVEDVMSNVAKAFVAEVSRQLEQDKPVWENKIYLDRPLICDGDGPVGQFRRWANQFYPEWYKTEARAAYDAAHGTSTAR